MSIEEKKQKVLDFFKQAFVVDGAVSFVEPDEAAQLLKNANISIVKLEDSRRGVFYVARLLPAAVIPTSE